MDKKELIRLAAINVIANEGYYNAKIKQIADKAGVAKGTIYLYFKDKQQILDYIFHVEINHEIKYLEGLQEFDYTPLEKFERFMRWYFKDMEDKSNIVKILCQEGIPNSKNSTNIRGMFYILGNKLGNIINDGKISGEIKDVETEPVVYMILHLLQGGLYGFRFNGNMVNYEKRKEDLFTFIIDGLSK